MLDLELAVVQPGEVGVFRDGYCMGTVCDETVSAVLFPEVVEAVRKAVRW
jgi:hypothetical protein